MISIKIGWHFSKEYFVQQWQKKVQFQMHWNPAEQFMLKSANIINLKKNIYLSPQEI